MPQACFGYLRLYNHYKAGYLWAEGGIREQPHVYLRVMEIMSAEINKIEHERLEERRREIDVKRR